MTEHLDGTPVCDYCGGKHTIKYASGTHTTKCPYVKSLEYSYTGRLKRIEFFSPNEMYVRQWATYPNTTGLTWPPSIPT